MDKEISLQVDAYEKICKSRVNFKKSPKERISEAYCQTRLESLEMIWAEFLVTHKHLVKSYGSALRDDDYVKKDVYEQVEEAYIMYKTDLKSALNAYAKVKQQRSDASQPSSQGTAKAESFKLPKIVIPTLTGKYTEWITFRDLFTSLIHNNSKLENVQKMHYLKSSLSGEAEQLLRQIPISEANYERCWIQLKNRQALFVTLYS